MMISYATTLFVFLFISSCSSLAFPGWENLQRRQVCYETDTLLSFQLYSEDSVPYCSSILNISDYTTFVGSTKTYTTTISTVTTTSYHTVETVTAPQSTAFDISTIDIVYKRQENAANPPSFVAPIPIVATATADDAIATNFPSIAQNASIAAEAYSACSCLSITSSTVTAAPSVQVTRTVNGFDVEALETITVANGTTTLTSTILERPTGYPTEFGGPLPNSTVPTPSTGYPPSVSNYPILSRPFPTLNITTIPNLSISAGIFPSFNGTAYPNIPISGSLVPSSYFTANPTVLRSGFLPLPTVNLTVNSTVPISGLPIPTANSTFNSTYPRSGLVPLPTANSSVNSTFPRSGLFPLPTVNLTTNFNASMSGRLPRPIWNTTASGRLPLPFVNATGRPLFPSTGFFPLPTLNATNRTFPTSGSPPVPTGVIFPTRPLYPTLDWTSQPATLLTGTAPAFAASDRPRLPLNISSSSIPATNTSATTLFRPIGTQIFPLGCPSINNTTYTTPAGDQYQLRCSVDYPGRSFADLDEPDLEGCIQKCSNINAAFPEVVPCDGVSFLQYASGVHCSLLDFPELLEGVENALAVSAVLLAGGTAVGK